MLAKINPDASLGETCVISCGFATGFGAPVNVAKPKKVSTVSIFGMGAVGLCEVRVGETNVAWTKLYDLDGPQSQDFNSPNESNGFPPRKGIDDEESKGRTNKSRRAEMESRFFVLSLLPWKLA